MKKLMKKIWRGHVPFKKVLWIGGIIIPAVLVIAGTISISSMSTFITYRSTVVVEDVNAYPRHPDRMFKLRKFYARRLRYREAADFIAFVILAYLMWISAAMMKHVFFAMEGPESRYVWTYAFLLFSCSLISFLLIVVLNIFPGVFYNQTGGFNVIGTYDNSCECRMNDQVACTAVPGICFLKMTDPPIIRNLNGRLPGGAPGFKSHLR